MSSMAAREELDRAIRERGENYAALSALIGRNPAYIQQFIRRGVPRKLDEADRRLLARYLQVDERLLGGSGQSEEANGPVVMIPRLEVDAAAGAGGDAGAEARRGSMAAGREWLRQIVPGSAHDLSVISVAGESMVPLLRPGDEILVDRADAADRLRDGIYVLRREDALVVKRVTVGRTAGAFNVSSDNPDYPAWGECVPGEIDVIGRVLWVGRRLS